MRISRALLPLATAVIAPAVFAGAAPAREVPVAVRAYSAPTLNPHAVPALSLRLRAPAHANVKRLSADPTVTELVMRRGRCTIRVGLLAEASDLQRLPRGRATGPVAVRGVDGSRHRSPARMIGPATSDGARYAARVFRLPAGTLPDFPFRTVLVGALQTNLARHCPKGALDRALVRALAHPSVSIVGDYPPDAPAPVVDVGRLPRLTIGGYQANGQLGSPPTTVVGDTDGDGRPELAVYDLRADATDVVDVGVLKGSVSLGDPAAIALRLPQVGSTGEVVPAGDVDGDGLQDVAVVEGDARIVLGRPAGATVDAAQPGAAYLTIAAGRGCGTVDEVVAAGDVDGDGLGDLAVTSRCDEARTLWLVPGGRGPGTVTLGAADDRAFPLAHGAALSLAAVGDVNADGLADLAVGWGARRHVHVTVFFGAAGHGPLTLAAPGGRGFVIDAGACADLYPAGPVGDVNGDGHADVLVSTTDECPEAGAFVVFGGASRPVDLETLVADGRGLALDAPADPLGGDATGDGLADLVVNGADDLAYVVAGRREPGTIELRRLASGGRAYRVPTGGRGSFVSRVLGVPDLDGDGRVELAFATPYLTVGGLQQAGAVQVLGSRAVPPG